MLNEGQAFRSSGNHDIPANMQVQNRDALLLQDKITPFDNLDLLPPPDANWLLSQIDDVTSTPLGRKGRANNRDINLQEDFNSSQFLQSGLENEDDLAVANMEDLDLELDFGMDIDERPGRMDKSFEIGRDAPAARGVEEDMFSELDIQRPNKGNRERDLSLDLDFGDRPNGVRIADHDGDLVMGDDDLQYNIGEQSVLADARARRALDREESPLSDIDEDLARQVDKDFREISRRNTDMYELGNDADRSMARTAAQRAKKKKFIQPDAQTMISNAAIKEQQDEHSNILKPQSFLPRDPYALGLMEMQRNGGFVSNILLDGRSANWAPELRGMLSVMALRPQNDLKRKRDSGVADVESDAEQGAVKSPRLNADVPDPLAMSGALGNQSVGPDGTVVEIPADDGAHFQEDDAIDVNDAPAFDETTAPTVHPADSGVVAAGTRHAVHVLRDLFGAEAATNEDKRKKTAVVFQELLPEQKTTKADATRMFFECLVLATKDAIKVEQKESALGGAIRVRGKRGLWGDWAEKGAGGEIAQLEEEEAAPAPLVAPVVVAVGA
jgi:cohesin complex subunit SCC1